MTRQQRGDIATQRYPDYPEVACTDVMPPSLSLVHLRTHYKGRHLWVMVDLRDMSFKARGALTREEDDVLFHDTLMELSL